MKKSIVIAKGDVVNGQSIVIAEPAVVKVPKKQLLKKLTKEQEEAIPGWIEKYSKPVFSGQFNKDFKFENAEAMIDWQYAKAGFDKPVVIVARSPYEATLMFNYIKNFYSGIVFIKLLHDLKNKKAVDINRSQLDSQLDSQLYSQLYSQLRSQLDSQLYSQLGSQLYSQLYSQLGSQLDSQLDSQLRSQLDSQLRSQLDSQLRSQLRSQLDSQLDSQLRSQLDSQLYSQLAISEENIKKLFENHDRYLWTSDVYTNVLLAWWDYMISILKLEGDIVEDFTTWRDLYINSGIYQGIYSKLVCIVSKYPVKIHRNAAGLLYNPNGSAVEWEDGWNCNYINGRHIPADIFNKAKTLTKKQFLQEKNSDHKGAWYEILGQKKMMDMLGAEVVDEQQIVHRNGDIETISLLKTKETFQEIDNQPFAWVKMVCPSTGTQYLQGVEPYHSDALSAIASLSPFKKEEYSFNFRS